MNKESENQNSRMSLTGQNFGIALLIGLSLTFLITAAALLMDVIIKFSKYSDFEFSMALNMFKQEFLPTFRAAGMCIVPVSLIFAFALLQRFRIKN